MVTPLWALNTIKNLFSPKMWVKVHRHFSDDATPQTPIYAKFCGYRLKNAADICDRKFVLPEKVGQSSPKSLKTCYPLRPPIVPNFIKISQTNLEKSVTKIGPRTKKNVCHGQKRDYLVALAVQEARLKIK